MKIFTVPEPVFKTEPLFVLGCTHERLNAYLKQRFKVEAGENIGQLAQMFTFADRTPWRVVWSREISVPIVLHEVFHLVTRICQDKGVPILAHDDHGNCGDEAAAYLFEFFATAVLRKLPAVTPRKKGIEDQPR